jgi:hypothetical protein
MLVHVRLGPGPETSVALGSSVLSILCSEPRTLPSVCQPTSQTSQTIEKQLHAKWQKFTALHNVKSDATPFADKTFEAPPCIPKAGFSPLTPDL